MANRVIIASADPLVIPLDLLRQITDEFSKERAIGSGSFGKVYKGVYPDKKEIAVKLLKKMPGIDETQFQNELRIMTSLRHQNIVRLVGYCIDIQFVPTPFKGKIVLAEDAHRVLCLEYMSNGSLDTYLSDEFGIGNWPTCYSIIMGICRGLKYLHELKPPIYHLDLKPSNILLDENMVPRIADFGISRLVGDEHTQYTKSVLGTLGYLPPEFILQGLISNKFDIFSLGVVIIKMIAGRVGYFHITEMSSKEFTNFVQEKWTNRLPETSKRNLYSEQLEMCIDIGLSCVRGDRNERPNIQETVYWLEETETKSTYAERNRLLIFQEANRNTLPWYAQDPNDGHTEQIYHGIPFEQLPPLTNYIGSEEITCYREATLDDDSQLYTDDDNQDYLPDGDPIPGIEGFQIVGDPRPGFTLRAGGFPTNGTTHGNFQWVRYLEDDTTQPIEGATTNDYVITADDVGCILAIEFTPMDENGRKGYLVRVYANSVNKITCDPNMQQDIRTCIARGRAEFHILAQGHSPNEWEKARLVLTRSGYQINSYVAAIEEKYASLQTKIPIGLTTRFVLVSSRGVNLLLSTHRIAADNDVVNDVRLRDLIVLVIRTFQNEAKALIKFI